MIDPAKRKHATILGGSVASALAVGALVGSALHSDAPTTLAPIQQTSEPELKPEILGMRGTDLLTGIVEPGQRETAVVRLPQHYGLVGDVRITGAAAGRFRIVATQLVGNEERVLVENTSSEPTAFSAVFAYDKLTE